VGKSAAGVQPNYPFHKLTLSHELNWVNSIQRRASNVFLQKKKQKKHFVKLLLFSL